MTRARAAGVVLLLAAAAAGFAPPAARATEVTAGELRTLARHAQGSRTALAELREVTSVDGRSVDIEAALSGARGDDLELRLEAIEEQTTDPPRAGGSDPRRDAREVLAQDRFHSTDVPGPLRGLRDRLRDLVPRNVFEWLDDLLPGGGSVVWIGLAAILFAVSWVISRKFLTRRIRTATEAAAQARGPGSDDPRTLDRRAAEAEAAGDLEAALRLRFRAGLLRLDARGAISFRPSISTYEVRRALHSEDFDALAATFDDVVYGGRAPEGADVADARDRWPAVVSGARERVS